MGKIDVDATVLLDLFSITGYLRSREHLNLSTDDVQALQLREADARQLLQSFQNMERQDFEGFGNFS